MEETTVKATLERPKSHHVTLHYKGDMIVLHILEDQVLVNLVEGKGLLDVSKRISLEEFFSTLHALAGYGSV